MTVLCNCSFMDTRLTTVSELLAVEEDGKFSVAYYTWGGEDERTLIDVKGIEHFPDAKLATAAWRRRITAKEPWEIPK